MTEGFRLLAPAAPAAPSSPTVGARPSVSVLIPVYDAAATIGDALESALAQRPAPKEVIVSDDGSRDDLSSALKPFARRVRVVNGPNRGLATARNRAAACARGDILALLDADDVWLPGRVDALTTAAMQRPDLDILTTDAVVVTGVAEARERYYQSREFFNKGQRLGILRNNFIFGAGAIRASAFRAVGGYRVGVRYAEDWDLWLRLVLAGAQAGLIDVPLYEYRRRAGSLSSHKLDLALGVLEMLQRAHVLVASDEERRQLRRTEQEWRVKAAAAARASHHPSARSLSLRAAAGSGENLMSRARLIGSVLVPRERRGREGCSS